jgi:hypothetical protein
MAEQKREVKILCPHRKTTIYLSKDNKEISKDGVYIDDKGNKINLSVFKVVERFTECLVGQQGIVCRVYNQETNKCEF